LEKKWSFEYKRRSRVYDIVVEGSIISHGATSNDNETGETNNMEFEALGSAGFSRLVRGGSDWISRLIGAGLRTPQLLFTNVDMGFWIVSGKYQIGISPIADSPVKIYNNGINIGPLSYQINQLGWSSKFEEVPGLNVGLNEPVIGTDVTSKMTIRQYEIEQTLSIDLEARLERLAALAVLSGSYEALLYLLTRISSGGVPSPAFP
jgi:hypothetical protein